MIVKKFEEQAQRFAHREAVITETTRLTYSQLNAYANRLAHAIAAIDRRPGKANKNQNVSLLFEHSADMIVGVMAAVKAGKVYVPLDVTYPETRLTYMLENSGSYLVLTNTRNSALAGKLAAAANRDIELQVVNINTITVDTGISSGNPERSYPGDQLAYILYTSGSTGRPKGVMQNHRNVWYYIRNWTQSFSITSSDRMTLFSAFSHDGAGQDMFGALLNGAALYPFNILNQPDIADLSRWLMDEKITIWHSVHTLFRYFVNTLDDEDIGGFTHLRCILLGGEAIRENDIRVFQRFFPRSILANVYGQTESSVNTIWKIKPGDKPRRMLIGEPLTGTKILLVDDKDEIIEDLGVGEIITACDHISPGYWNDKENTEKVFTHDPELGKLYFTGDLGRLLADGNIEFMGRKDSQVKIRGFRVEIGEIETRLLNHQAVKEVVVVPLAPQEDENHTVRLCAYIVPCIPNPGSSQDVNFTVSHMREYLSGELPEHMIPSYLVTMEALPVTPNGKIDRKRLPRPELLRPRLGVTYIAPQTNREKEVSDIWKEILQLDKVGINDHFFDLGGTSFDILKIMRKIHEVFHIDVPVVSIFRHPTIGSFAAYLEQEERGGHVSHPDRASIEKEKLYQFKRRNARPSSSAQIAVIGMAGAFPGAKTIDQYWENLKTGVESITFFPPPESEQGEIDPHPSPDSYYVSANGMMADIEYFDAGFFNYSPHEARMMDPQLRLLHECSWEALGNAGYNPDAYDGYIGIYAGSAPNQYWVALTYLVQGQTNSPDTLFLNQNYSTKVSYKLNLRGPSVIIQTACSTSLVAIHFACRGLIDKECDMALAGGVSIALPDRVGYLYREGMILSKDGHCRTFDANAGGTIFGNGVGMVVLKPLEDALADGDTIDAVIKGSAINNDGNRKIGITAPSVEGEAEVIAAAQQLANLDPESIGYIEAHGTGTPMGDPVEMEALNLAFAASKAKNKRKYCAVGSVKTNIGHLNAAAGAAGFIKTVLVLKYKLIPPSLHFETPNPAIDFENSPFFVNTQLMEWKHNGQPLRAGVSSFGIGGTNAHVVLEEWPPAQSAQCQGRGGVSPPPLSRPYQLILLSAKTPSALDKMTENLVNFLKKDPVNPDENPGINLADAAYTLQLGRKAFKYRRMFVCSRAEELEEMGRAPVFAAEEGRKPLIFMFSGQGTQYVNMGLGLYQSEPLFREEIDRCFEILDTLLDDDIKEILYPSTVFNRSNRSNRSYFNQTEIVQPLLFAFEYALAKLLMAWGIRPTAMIGYSLGEYIAACLAGVFSLADALKLVVTRGRLMKQTTPGAMLSVPLPEEEIKPLLTNNDVSLAIVNDPTCIVAGTAEAAAAFEKKMKSRRLMCGRLDVPYGMHSPLMAPIREAFEKSTREISLNPPCIPYISNVTGNWITREEAVNPGYWGEHLCTTVRFSAGIKKLLKQDNAVFIEIGSGRTLCNLVRRHADNNPNQMIINLVRHREEKVSDEYYLLKRAGQLWLYGIGIDWHGFYHEGKKHRIHLPAYPFEGLRYWIEGNPLVAAAKSNISRHARVMKEPEEIAASFSKRFRPELSNAYAPPNTRTQQILVNIWEDLLGIPQVGIDDNFIELGGDSLKAVNFAGRIHQETNTIVPLPEFFSRPTIRLLAQYIDEKEEKIAFSSIPSLEKKEYYYLSPAQTRLYILQQMEKAGTGYNLPSAVLLEGDPDICQLEDALKQLIKRHEGFRTSFEMVSGGPVQRIHEEVKFETRYLEGMQEARDSFVRPFDLSRAPLFRVGLIKQQEKKYLLVVDIHHIIHDGTSTGIFFKELTALYREKELSSLRIQYKDYAGWQYSQAALAARKKQETYWLEVFSDEIPVINLPLDFPRPPIQSYEGSRRNFVLEEEKTNSLKTLAKEQGATLYMALLAVINTLLLKLSGQNDIVVGTVLAGRKQPDLRQVMGMFVNTLALRNYPHSDKTFKEFLAEIKEQTLKAFENQDYPFEELVEKIKIKRDISRNPIFDVMFRLHNFEAPGSQIQETPIEELKLTQYGINPNTSIFDLDFGCYETDNTLIFSIDYCTKLFKEETIVRFSRYFKKIVETVPGIPGRKLWDIEIITPEEKQQILYDFNDTRMDYPKDKTIYQLFEEQVERTPDNIAAAGPLPIKNRTYMTYTTYITYRKLNEKSHQLANLLREKGVQTDTVVGIMVSRSIEMISGLLGILTANGAYLPIDPDYPGNRIKYMLADSRVSILLTTRDLSNEIAFEKETIYLPDATNHAPGPPRPRLSPRVNAPAGCLAYVIYTSGSTNKPKGVMIRHDNIVNFITGITAKINFPPGQRILALTTISFDIFVLETWLPLTRGMQVVMADEQRQIDSQLLAETIIEQGIDILQATPSRLKLLIGGDHRLTCLQKVWQLVVGGEAFPLHLLKHLQKIYAGKIYNVFGPTETTVWSTVKELTRSEAVNIGVPIANTRVYIVDRYIRLQPPGIAGELCIGGDSLARGYLNKPGLTAGKFCLRRPGGIFSAKGDRCRLQVQVELSKTSSAEKPSLIGSPRRGAPWIPRKNFLLADVPGQGIHTSYRSHRSYIYRTGDLARWLCNGELEFLGRMDYQVKIRGFRVELEEIENLLLKQKDIKEAVVISKVDDNKDTYLCAYFVNNGDFANGPGPTELREHLAGTLPHYMIPSYFLRLEKMPLTSNGKIDRKSLPGPDASRPRLQASYVEPNSHTEKMIADAWKEILKPDKIGIYDNFFELGGNSLDVVKVTTRMSEIFQKNIPVVSLFRYRTIHSLAGYLDREQEENIPIRHRAGIFERSQQIKQRRLQMRKESTG